MQDLPPTDAFCLRLIGFHVRDGTGLPPPGVVDEELRVHAEHFIEQFLVVIIRRLADGAAGDIPHGVKSFGLQLPGIAGPHPPKVCQGPMVPQILAVALLRQLGDADAVFVRRDALGPDVHSDFAQVQVRPDPRRGGDTRGLQYVQDDLHSEITGAETVGPEVVRHVHQDLVDGVIDNILRRDIFEVHVVDPGTPLHVMSHPGRSHDVVHRQAGVRFQLGVTGGGAGKLTTRCLAGTISVDLLDPLDHLEEPRPSGDAPGFQGGRHRQADGLLRPAQVRHNEVGGQGVQAPFNTLDGGVKTFQVTGDISPVPHGPRLLQRKTLF